MIFGWYFFLQPEKKHSKIWISFGFLPRLWGVLIGKLFLWPLTSLLWLNISRKSLLLFASFIWECLLVCILLPVPFLVTPTRSGQTNVLFSYRIGINNQIGCWGSFHQHFCWNFLPMMICNSGSDPSISYFLSWTCHVWLLSWVVWWQSKTMSERSCRNHDPWNK